MILFSSKQRSFTSLYLVIQRFLHSLFKSKIAVRNRIMIHICSKFQKHLQSWGGGCAPIKSQLGSSDPPSPPLLHHCLVPKLEYTIPKRNHFISNLVTGQYKILETFRTTRKARRPFRQMARRNCYPVQRKLYQNNIHISLL